MIRIALLAAALSVSAYPALSSEWMGSLQFTNGANFVGSGANWTASLKNGKGSFKVNGTKFGKVERSNSFFIVSSGGKNGGVIGTGIVHKGTVSGMFQVGKGGIAGTFDGAKVSKSGKGKK